MAKKNFQLKTATTSGINITSVKEMQGSYRYEEVQKEMIIPNEKNKNYSQEDLEELKSSIMLRLIHPLSVVYDFDTSTYRLISGERRYRSICLMTDAEYKKAFPNGIPCMVQNAKDLNTIDEEILLIAANHEVRATDGKLRLWEIKRLLELYSAKKANKEVTNIKNALAKQLNVSAATIMRTKNVLDTLPEIQQLYEEGKLTLLTAEACVRLTEAGQLAVAKIVTENGEITKEELSLIQKKESRSRSDINEAKRNGVPNDITDAEIAAVANLAKKRKRENSLIKVEKVLATVKKHPNKYDKEETLELLKRINTMTKELMAQLEE